MRKRRGRRTSATPQPPAVGSILTFRAEVMPGRERVERTFEVIRVLSNGRVELAKIEGQHSLAEFERLT